MRRFDGRPLAVVAGGLAQACFPQIADLETGPDCAAMAAAAPVGRPGIGELCLNGTGFMRDSLH
jgi:hypothetical protein